MKRLIELRNGTKVKIQGKEFSLPCAPDIALFVHHPIAWFSEDGEVIQNREGWIITELVTSKTVVGRAQFRQKDAVAEAVRRFMLPGAIEHVRGEIMHHEQLSQA